ncbi:integrator complex subunit 3 homolog [Dendroctonus ponderosae]|uniref:integrator complex subunit 3 homolog n=1 Tax=Dendroctonus ponderosae TaxID=77166 RepID=UPI0020355678|nr:integrator complex subunit 3 homolog [Dendroctonus ponderosae]
MEQGFIKANSSNLLRVDMLMLEEFFASNKDFSSSEFRRRWVKRIIRSEAPPPRLYGLPKIHKEGIPLRPIVSAPGSLTYDIAKYLSSLLQPHLRSTETYIKNSEHFIKKIQDLSFDVVSLFTKGPMEESIELVAELFEESTTNLFKASLKGSYFLWNGDYYEQQEVVAMGSPLSPVVENLFMEKFEETALSTAPPKPTIWYRYVDDTFVLWRHARKNLDIFLDHLTKQHPDIQFTLSVYIGTSKRSIATRIEEDRRNCKLGHVEKSAVAEHALGDGTHNIYFGEAQVLATTTGYRPRLIREAIEIHKHDDNFNRKEEAMALNRIWFPALSNAKRARRSNSSGHERRSSTPEDSNSQQIAQAPMTQATSSQTTSSHTVHKYGLRPRNDIRTVEAFNSSDDLPCDIENEDFNVVSDLLPGKPRKSSKKLLIGTRNGAVSERYTHKNIEHQRDEGFFLEYLNFCNRRIQIFAGVLQLLQNRTSRRFLQSRLTPEMERKLVFLTSQVRFGNHKRYQDWFQRQYLATPESQSLRCDIIRFIVGVIHPTNELLCSDIIPRWAVIGWLLTTCTSNVAVSNAKLALFYDWLFYDVEKDNIMNIEPAILVMHHSMRSHPAVTATLLDFLCRIINHFYPPLSDKVRTGIFSSLRQILDKRVLPSLVPLFDNSKLDRDLRNMVKETFREFCTEPSNLHSSSSTSREDLNNVNKFEDETIEISLNNHLLDSEPTFSDDDDESELKITSMEDDTDDDDIPLSKVRLKEKSDKSDDSFIDGLLGDLLGKLQEEIDSDKRCYITEEIIAELIELDINKNQSDEDMLCSVSRAFANCIIDDLPSDKVFPDVLSQDKLTDSVRKPLFVILKTVYGYSSSKDDQTKKSILIRFLAEMHSQLPCLGYFVLYFLKVQIRTENKKDDNTKASALKIALYKEFCNSIEKKLDQCLYDDLYACHMVDTKLMMWIVPDLYRDFKQHMVNNAQTLKVIISAIDAKQLQTLVGKVLQGHLVMFKTENLHSLLKATLCWESIEQFFFWQLINAHDFNIDTVLPLITELDYDLHPEALTAIMLMLKQEKPNADYIKCLFSRDICDNGDLFIFTVIKYWCDEYIDKVAELISALLSTRYPSTSPNKRKRTNAGNKVLSTTVPSADQVLGHLEKLRIICEKHDCMAIYTLDSMQRALSVAQSNSNDSQRKLFGELFALMEEEEEISATKSSRLQGRGRKPASSSKPPVATVSSSKRQAVRDLTDSSDDSSEEEEIVKPKQAKKRKKILSESD